MRFQYVSMKAPYELREAEISENEVDRLRAEYESDKNYFWNHWHCHNSTEYIEVLLSMNC